MESASKNSYNHSVCSDPENLVTGFCPAFGLRDGLSSISSHLSGSTFSGASEDLLSLLCQITQAWSFSEPQARSSSAWVLCLLPSLPVALLITCLPLDGQTSGSITAVYLEVLSNLPNCLKNGLGSKASNITGFFPPRNVILINGTIISYFLTKGTL